MKRIFVAMFRHPTPEEIEARDLEHARRKLAELRSTDEYIRYRIAMYEERIARLEAEQKGAE